jgi:hypothetical protein
LLRFQTQFYKTVPIYGSVWVCTFPFGGVG